MYTQLIPKIHKDCADHSVDPLIEFEVRLFDGRIMMTFTPPHGKESYEWSDFAAGCRAGFGEGILWDDNSGNEYHIGIVKENVSITISTYDLFTSSRAQVLSVVVPVSLVDCAQAFDAAAKMTLEWTSKGG